LELYTTAKVSSLRRLNPERLVLIFMHKKKGFIYEVIAIRDEPEKDAPVANLFTREVGNVVHLTAQSPYDEALDYANCGTTLSNIAVDFEFIGFI
jgi:hypothetical protein